MLDDLRQRVRALERPAWLEEEAAAVPIGVQEVDAVLGGGLMRGALHEIAAASEAHLPAATGFVVGLAKQASAPALGPASASFRKPGRDRGKAIVWLAEDVGLAESGVLYGPGLDGCGIAPERLLTVAVAHRRDLLWAMEEALHCRAVGLIVGELRAGALDAVAVRRLSLAAAETGALAFLLRACPPEDASTAATRWIVKAAPSPAERGEEAPLSLEQAEVALEVPSAFTAHLTRNRRGTLGSWILTWSDRHGFQLATHPQPVAAPPDDRPHCAVA